MNNSRMPAETYAKALRAARALIDSPEKWTRGAYARDAERRAANPTDNGAVCFCALGALERAVWGCSLSPVWLSALELLVELEIPMAWRATAEALNLAAYNDDPHMSHTAVLALFDAAIAKLERASTTHSDFPRAVLGLDTEDE